MGKAARGRAYGTRVHRLRQAEVEDLDLVVCRDLDVRGFQIAMNDASLVRRLEGFGNLHGDAERCLHRNRAALNAVGQGFPLDQLEDDRARLS